MITPARPLIVKCFDCWGQGCKNCNGTGDMVVCTDDEIKSLDLRVYESVCLYMKFGAILETGNLFDQPQYNIDFALVVDEAVKYFDCFYGNK